MKNSDKHLLTSAIISITGFASIINLAKFNRALVEESTWWVLIGLGIIFFVAGSYHGSARGWHEIEIRRQNPEIYAGEKVEDA